MSKKHDERVAKGAELITKKLGEGWENEISLEDLDLAEPEFCVLGQCFEDYNCGLHDLGLDDGSTMTQVHHGFEAQYDKAGINRMYKPLQAAWVKYLKARRA